MHYLARYNHRRALKTYDRTCDHPLGQTIKKSKAIGMTQTQALIPPDCATVSWFCASSGERRGFSGREISRPAKVGLQSFALLMPGGSLK